MPSRSALGALPRTGTGEARERGRRPLGHVAGLRPACGRDARAPRVWPCERCSWERGHLARTGPKARKVPRGATCLSHQLPRPRRGHGSDGVSRERGCRPLAHVAGLWPACGRDARAPREWPCERCPWERGPLARNGPKARKAPRGATHPSRPPPAPEAPNAVEVGLGCPAEDGHWRSPRAWASPACPCGGPVARLRAGRPRSQGVAPEAMFLGARASCPHRAEGPQSAERSDTPEPATPRARGAQCRRGRPWVHCRGRALEKPESVGVARLAMWRACGPLAGGTPALPGCGPVSDVPGSAGILPAPGRRPAKRRQERHARAGHPPARGAQCRRGRPWVPCRGRALEKPESVGVARLPMRRACGPLAGGTPALPGGGPGSDVPGSAGILPASGRRPAKRREERHTRAGHPPRPRRPMPSRPALGACRGRALEKPESVGVARLAMWRACGPLAGGTPALPGCGPVSDVPGSAGILPAPGRRPAKRRQERHARAGHPPARGAQCRRGRPWVPCRGRALEKPESVGVARLAMWRACRPACGRDARAPRVWPCERCSWERGHLARTGPKARKAPTEATRPSRLLPRPRRPMPSRPALGALPRTGTGGARERGRCPLGHVAGLRPACGRDARAPRGWPCERCSWERGHLARNGPKARKVPTEATRPSRPPPARGAQCRRGRPWVHCRGRALEKPESVGVARLAMWRACGPLAGGTPALPGCGLGSDGVSRERGCRPLAHVAGLWPACGRDARAPRGWPCERCSWERGHLARNGPKARKAPRGATRPSRPPPRARGAQCRRGRPCERCSWERGHLARNGPKARKAPRGATCPSRPPPPPEAPNAVEAGLVSDVPGSAGILPATGRRPAKCRQERHGPSRPHPAPEAPNAVEVPGSLGASAEDGRWRSPQSVDVARLAMWRACGPLAGGTPALPGWVLGSDVPGSAGILPATGRRPAKRRQERHARAGHTPRPRRPMPSRSALGALPRTGAGGARERGVSPACRYGGPVARLRAGRPRSQGVAL